MRFPGVRLVEQTEQKFRRIRVCPKKSDCQALLSYNRRLKTPKMSQFGRS